MTVLSSTVAWALSAIINYSSLTIPATYNNAADIPTTLFEQHETLNGRVVKVIDGDTLRIRHTPIPSMKNNFEGKLSDNTITVRLYGIDAPETAKQGKPGMPYGIEATEFTKKLVNGKDVKVKLLRKDQYGRVIGVLTVHPTACINIVTTKTTCPDEDLSLELAKNGLAFLYTGKGSEYDGHKIQFKDNIASAKKEKKGVWVNGVENVLLPSDYKRQYQ